MLTHSHSHPGRLQAAQILLLGHNPIDGELLAVTEFGGRLRLMGDLSALYNGALSVQDKDPFNLLFADGGSARKKINGKITSLRDGILIFLFSDRRDPAAARLLAMHEAQKSTPADKNTLHQQLRAISKDSLHTVMTSFAESVEQQLLQQFRESTSNQDQLCALETAELLQNSADTIAEKFSAAVLSNIDQCNHYRARKERDADSVRIEELAIVDKGTYEDTLAINAIVTRLSDENQDAQGYLRRLFSSWLDELICDERLPVGVAMVGQAFRSAIDPLDIPAKLRETVYDAFEASLRSTMPEWYSLLNNQFDARGVQPWHDELKADQPPERPVASPTEGASGRPGPPADASSANIVPIESVLSFRADTESRPLDADKTRQLYDTVLSVMQLRDVSQDLTAAPNAEPALIRAIDEIQQDSSALEAIGDGVSLVQKIRHALPESCRNTLPAAVSNKAELIDTVFTSIVDEQVVAANAKPLLRRFALPFLKLVLMDERFLSNKGHPARQLLNQIAVLAGYADGTSTQIERSLSTMLERISTDYTGAETTLFTELLGEVDSLIEQQQMSHTRNAERVVDAYEGKQTLEQAHKAVKRALCERILGAPVPQLVIALLEAGWRELLVMGYCKSGAQGEKFQGCLSLLDRLLCLLREGSEKGLVPPNVTAQAESRTIIQIVERELNNVFPGNCRHQDVVKKLRAILLGTEEGAGPIAFVELDPASNWYGVALSEGEPVRSVEQPEALRRWCERASSLAVGDWIGDVHQSDRGQDLRLAWRSMDGDRFVFVNRLGRKEAEYRLLELATRMQQGWQLLEADANWSPVDRGLYQMLQKVYDELDVRRCNDELTELLNRKEFENRVGQTVVSSRRQGSGHILLQVDLDEFRAVNDMCGMLAGDQLLKDIAKLLVSKLSASATLARIGSNEFGALMENCTIEGGREAAEVVRLAIQNHRFEWQGKSYSLTASIGVCVMNEYSADVVGLFRQLNSACQMAKEEGHNRVILASQENEDHRKREDVLAWAARINRALDDDNLTLRCQRIEPLTKDVAKPHYEILLGVRDEEDNEVLVPPDKFIAAAERFNRMQDVDRWVVKRVVEWMKQNSALMEGISGVSINLSGNTLNDDYFPGFLAEELQGMGDLLPRICFEITETATISNLSKAADFIRSVKSMGCKFALDDFGTGLSSYEYLKRLPVDFLKIDGCFIKDIVDNDCDFAVVKSINEIGHFMGKKTIAEYVENEEILGLLREIGVDYAQGYGVEKPRLLSELTVGPVSVDISHSSAAS